MKQYFKNYNTFLCFDDEEKTITTVTSNTTVDSKSMVYTKDDRMFDNALATALKGIQGDGSLGPNTTGWAEITEAIFNQAKAEVKAFFMNL